MPLPQRSRRGRPRRALVTAALLACVATACSPAAASSDEVVAEATSAPAVAAQTGGSSPGGAVAVALRAGATAADGMPDVTGAAFEHARVALRAAGARGAALVFEEGAEVTAQFPAAGRPVPDDATVVVWVGSPTGVTVEVVVGETVVPLANLGDLDPAAPAFPAIPAEDPDGVPVGDDAAADDALATSGDGAGTPQPDGLASWYGPGFEGDLTPCGERVDPERITFAGPDLPCGTTVRVTGPDGRVIEAILTDRGPASWTGRRYNLSQAAFAALADLDTGVVPVRVEALD